MTSILSITQLLTSFPPTHQIEYYHAINACKLPREVEAGEAVHTPDCNICHLKSITHLYTHCMAPPSLCWYPDAPEPLSGENLAPLEKNQAYTTKVGTDVKRGRKV